MLEAVEDAGEGGGPLARRRRERADAARGARLQLREHVDLGLAQAEIRELGGQVVEHAVHGGLEGGDHGGICHEFVLYGLVT